MLPALSRAFNRGDDFWSYAEESSLVECARRPKFHSELDELLVFRSQPKSFFPRSVSRLLSDWQATLDRARNHLDESAPIKPATLMDKEAARQLAEAKRL